MKIIQEIVQLQTAISKLDLATIGFVPTMGALHEGHEALIKKAKEENDLVVVSIFVNPTEFGPHEDYESYPRDLEADAKVCAILEVDILFAPSVSEMYRNNSDISFNAGSSSKIMCGATRPGHFNGVLQIFNKFFGLINPTRVYFGQKDAQKIALLRAFVHDYYLPIEIKMVPTVRDLDGLAYSARNGLLTEQERQQAVELHRALLLAKARLKDGEEQAVVLMQARSKLEQTVGKVDYMEFLSYPDLTKDVHASEYKILAAALQFSTVRLIENEIFE
ncbi:MAG: pantoate--beta-alanine ligase [Kurthia sp.]|nr:pantoate--beta-alanine ligase [Candidatus Kurthia equi]